MKALSSPKEAGQVFAPASDPLKGRRHGQKPLVSRGLSTAEGRADYLDQAVTEYAAAVYHYG